MPSVYESLLRAALLLAVVFAVTALGIALVRGYRRRENQDAHDANEMMTGFRDVYERGGLSDEEFRKIRAKLATELKGEESDARNAG